jgi:hypothetical protein
MNDHLGDFGLATNFRGGRAAADVVGDVIVGRGGAEGDDMQELTHGVGTTL